MPTPFDFVQKIRLHFTKPKTSKEQFGLDDTELWLLATYNDELGRGIVHTPEWEQVMSLLQQRFDEHSNSLGDHNILGDMRA